MSQNLCPIDAVSRRVRPPEDEDASSIQRAGPAATAHRLAALRGAPPHPPLPLGARMDFRQASAVAAPHRTGHRNRAPGGARSSGVCRGGHCLDGRFRFRPAGCLYRNVRAQPKIVIEVGTRHSAVTARFLTPEEGTEAMSRRARRHPVSPAVCAVSWASPRTAATRSSARPAGRSPLSGRRPGPIRGCPESCARPILSARQNPFASTGVPTLHHASIAAERTGGRVAQRPGVIGTPSRVRRSPAAGEPPAVRPRPLRAHRVSAEPGDTSGSGCAARRLFPDGEA